MHRVTSYASLLPSMWRLRVSATSHPRLRACVLMAFCLGVLTDAARAEESKDGIWETAALHVRGGVQPQSRPAVYRTLIVDWAKLRQTLAQAPLEGSKQAQPVIMTLPMPDGNFSRFKLIESPIMEPELAAQFPEIKTYSGKGLDDPVATVRLDTGPKGIHAQILSPNGAVYLDPFTPGDKKFCICYYKRDYRREADAFSCLVAERSRVNRYETTSGEAARSGSVLRSYRLACAATGEYTQFHGGTVGLGMAAVVTAINRVTQVYEVEFSIRFLLVANNGLLIYTNPVSDPYSNFDPFSLLFENQANIDAIIGNANYDVGHVLTTDEGGVAGLGVVGQTGGKAQGVSGRSSPVGDPLYIDILSHEFGHQFNADHSFNGNSGSCSANRNGITAYEPGSGSTILAYAGICANDDLQAHSDPYFHSISFDQVIQFVDLFIPATGTRTATGNTVPTVDAGSNYTIPSGTPFELTAIGSDSDPDALTFNWEERDLGPQQGVNAGDNGSSPLFRSWTPTISPLRTFPRIVDLINNTTSIGETLPTTTRVMNFRATVRDNRLSGGGVNTDDMVLNIIDGNPFRVLTANSPFTVKAFMTGPVLWDVAGTDGNGINTALVNILLSLDGGLTYPITLVANTPNDGLASVVVPNAPTSLARIRVEAVNNVFFDISDSNFTISPPDPTFTLDVTPGVLGVCAPENATYTVDVLQFNQFSDPVTLSASGNPAGTSVDFSVNPVIPGGGSLVTVSGIGAADVGAYILQVDGTSSSRTESNTASLLVATGPPDIVTLVSPVDCANDVSSFPTLIWLADPLVTNYVVELDDDPLFASPEFTSITSANSVTVGSDLDTSTVYYWRVTAQNACDSTVSSVNSFMTINAPTPFCRSPNLSIPDFNAIGVFDTMSVSDSGVITDLDLSLNVVHTRVGHLRILLEHVDTATSVTVFDLPGYPPVIFGCSGNDIDVALDDEATLLAEDECSNGGQAYLAGQRYKPNNPLSAFDGQSLSGTWKLTVIDIASGDTGSLLQWCVQASIQSVATTTTSSTSSTTTTSTVSTTSTSTTLAPPVIVELNTNITLRAIVTPTGTIAPVYATNLKTTPIEWLPVPIYSNTSVHGTNIFEFDIPDTNAPAVYFRLLQIL